LPVENIRIIDISAPDCSPTLFDNQIEVASDEDKSHKVLSSLTKHTSRDAYHNIYKVYLSYYPEKGNLIFRYIKLAFSLGRKVFEHISHPIIAEIHRIVRRVGMESHKLLGFVRFQQLEMGAYFSRITPENNQLELIAPHFVDRLFKENWIIYDAKRKLACVHHSGQNFIITDDIPNEILNDDMDNLNSGEELIYQNLWKTFFDTIGIESRFNPKCQMNLLPKRYWENMLELKDKL